MKKIIDRFKLIHVFIGVLIGGIIFSLLSYFGVINLKREYIATFNGGKVSNMELYKELRSQGGLDALLNMIDYELVKGYASEDEATKSAEENANNYFNLYQTNYGYSKEEFLQANGFKTESEFINYLKKDYYFNKYYESYLRNLISDEEAKSYYDQNAFGDKLNVYIVTSKDKNKLNKVYNKFKKNKDTKILDNETSVNASSIDVLGFLESSNYSSEFLTNLVKLNKKDVSKIFKDEIYDYVFIYVDDARELASFDSVKDSIKDTLGNSKSLDDNTLYYKAFIKLRKDANLKITDYDLNKSYEDYVKIYE